MLGMLLLMLVAGIACYVALAAVGRRQRQAEQQVQRGRAAQRVAPPTPASDPLGQLLLHIEAQLHRLHGERSELRRLRDRGHRLRREMQRSEALRERLAAVETGLEQVERRGREVDGLIDRYASRRDDLRVLQSATAFLSAVADTADPIDDHAAATAALDEQAERLLDVAAAEAELVELLRG